MPRAPRSRITYPTNRLLAVIDDPTQARQAAAALHVAGVPVEDIAVLLGDEGIERLGSLGPPRGRLGGVVRAVQFMSMDQTPDFHMYEAALADGRAVLAVRAADRDRMLGVRDLLVRHGAHFLNHFGRLSTEELTTWRGPEPDIPGLLRR